MLPIVTVESCKVVENVCDEFKKLLNSLLLDVIDSYVKTDKIILMIGARSFGVLKRKKYKKVETRKSVRARMRSVVRVYLCFREIYSNQTEVKLTDQLENAADMYRREAIGILGSAVHTLIERSSEDVHHVSVTGKKSGLKVSILNLLKRTAKFLI